MIFKLTLLRCQIFDQRPAPNPIFTGLKKALLSTRCVSAHRGTVCVLVTVQKEIIFETLDLFSYRISRHGQICWGLPQ